MLRGLLDRLILVLGVLAGGSLPSFIAQYRQRLGGALDQVQKDLAPFQQIADQQHGGSLSALIQHHLDSIDATFHAEGQAIQAMVESAAALQRAAEALSTDVWHQMAYLTQHADPALTNATWAMFQPSFGLSIESLQVAAAVGITLWLVFIVLWYASGAVAHRRTTPLTRPR